MVKCLPKGVIPENYYSVLPVDRVATDDVLKPAKNAKKHKQSKVHAAGIKAVKTKKHDAPTLRGKKAEVKTPQAKSAGGTSTLVKTCVVLLAVASGVGISQMSKAPTAPGNPFNSGSIGNASFPNMTLNQDNLSGWASYRCPITFNESVNVQLNQSSTDLVHLGDGTLPDPVVGFVRYEEVDWEKMSHSQIELISEVSKGWLSSVTLGDVGKGLAAAGVGAVAAGVVGPATAFAFAGQAACALVAAAVLKP
jgi:hypothetical protein